MSPHSTPWLLKEGTEYSCWQHLREMLPEDPIWDKAAPRGEGRLLRGHVAKAAADGELHYVMLDEDMLEALRLLHKAQGKPEKKGEGPGVFKCCCVVEPRTL